jgi:non-canonical (house-cleaning) NTP pyrophosphatase
MAMGIEIGYQKNRTGKYEILCWVSIVDQKLVISQMSRSFPLPEFHQKVLRAGKYLSDHVRDYYKDASHPVKKYLGTMVQTRESFIEVAIEHALLKYFMEKLKI